MEAGEDIRLALKGLEQMEGVANIDSDEERMEVGSGLEMNTVAYWS